MIDFLNFLFSVRMGHTFEPLLPLLHFSCVVVGHALPKYYLFSTIFLELKKLLIPYQSVRARRSMNEIPPFTRLVKTRMYSNGHRSLLPSHGSVKIIKSRYTW